MNDFFSKSLISEDTEIVTAINEEFYRQQNTIELIASENIASRAVIAAQANILTNKYAEGYPGNRYYGGCQFVDKIEQIAINRAKELFNAKYVNVQPHSGSQANFAVFLSLLNPGDCVMGMSLNSGGHLTHGSKVSVSGKWFNSVSYDINKETELLDYDEIRKMAIENKPKLIIAGYSAYSRIIDFSKFRDIAKEVGAYLLVDMAHIAGLVAGGVYDNPLDFADVVTSTTHKTLRGPRGGLILTNDKELAKKINSAIFPGMQGGPLMHVIAAKAVAFKEALTEDFKIYAKNIIKNTKAMCDVFINKGFKVISGGTDTHLFIVDLIGSEFNKDKNNITGNIVANNLDEINITCNKNSIPFDTLPPKTTSGIRMGCAAITTRGMGVVEAKNIANIIIKALTHMASGEFNDNFKKIALSEVKNLCEKYPIYGGEVSIK